MRNGICLALTIYYVFLMARIILSWLLSANVQPPHWLRPVVEVIYTLTDPPLRLVQPLVPPVRLGMMALDLSPLIVFFILLLVRGAVCRVA